MTKTSRTKGARGEREAAALLREALPDGWTVERFGTGEAGHDLRLLSPKGKLSPFAIEVKRYADFEVGEACRGSARFRAWWRQARAQADRAGREPVLLTRGDRRPWWLWSVRQYGDPECLIELRIPIAEEPISECVIGVPLDQAIADLANEIREGADHG